MRIELGTDNIAKTLKNFDAHKIQGFNFFFLIVIIKSFTTENLSYFENHSIFGGNWNKVTFRIGTVEHLLLWATTELEGTFLTDH